MVQTREYQVSLIERVTTQLDEGREPYCNFPPEAVRRSFDMPSIMIKVLDLFEPGAELTSRDIQRKTFIQSHAKRSDESASDIACGILEGLKDRGYIHSSERGKSIFYTRSLQQKAGGVDRLTEVTQTLIQKYFQGADRRVDRRVDRLTVNN